MPENPQVPEVATPAKPVQHEKYPWPAAPTLIGKRIQRLDGPVKVTGQAKYCYDINRPGGLHGRILRSPHPHARIVAIDLTAAEKAPGVKAVMPVMKAGDKVMFQGEEVAALAAATEDQADDALRLIKVQYEVLPHIATPALATRDGAPLVFKDGNVKAGDTEEAGDLEAGFKAAAHVVEASYATQVQTHVSLETHGCVCEWEGDKLTAWVSTQAVHGTREGFAKALDIPQTNVRVICEYMGGGFGSKFGPDAQGVICAKLAKQAGAAVKLMLDRKDEHLASGNRPSSMSKIRAGVSADGMLTAFDAETSGTGGAGAGAGFPLPYIYVFPNRRRRHRDIFTNAGPQRAMRAPGHPQGCFHTEMLMDELADKLRMDPVALRIKNLPPEAPNAMWRKYFPLAAERFGWSKRHATGDPTPGPIKRGMGCAANRWGGGGQGTQGALRDQRRRQRRHALRHAGHRRRHRDHRGDDHGRDAGDSNRAREGGDRRQQPPVQRRVWRQHDGAGGVARDPRHRGHGARRVEGQGRARPRRRSSDARGERRPHSLEGRPVEGPRVEGRLQAAGDDAGVGRRAVGDAGSRPAARAACSSPRSRWTSRPA